MLQPLLLQAEKAFTLEEFESALHQLASHAPSAYAICDAKARSRADRLKAAWPQFAKSMAALKERWDATVQESKGDRLRLRKAVKDIMTDLLTEAGQQCENFNERVNEMETAAYLAAGEGGDEAAAVYRIVSRFMVDSAALVAYATVETNDEMRALLKDALEGPSPADSKMRQRALRQCTRGVQSAAATAGQSVYACPNCKKSSCVSRVRMSRSLEWLLLLDRRVSVFSQDVQLRSADEGMTTMVRCLACNFEWAAE